MGWPDPHIRAALTDEGAAYALEALMSGISEEFWCAGWMNGNEYALWTMVEGGKRAYGMGEVPESAVLALKHLADTADGWWHWPEDSDALRFISLDKWRALLVEKRGAARRFF
jgi:hypothetical protein